MNDVLRSKGSVSLPKEAFDASGTHYAPGTLLIENTDNLRQLAAKYHLTMHGLSARPNVPGVKLKEVRVGLYKPWVASMDEGWTRWVLEQYDFNPKNIILPDIEKNVIVEGRSRPLEGGAPEYFEELPPECAGGIGKEGTKALKDFADEGGTLIALASSGELLIEELNLPVRNVLHRLHPEEFSSPGSLLRIHLDRTNPLAYGMPEEVAAFVSEPIAYQTSPAATDIQRSVLARYPTDSEDTLLSGWIHGADRLVHHAAAVTFTRGKGQVVLFGFRVQNRAQTEGTFKLLFNAIQWAGLK